MAQIAGVKEMTTNIVGKTQGSWHCDAKLGSGSFGIIHIWSNIKDDFVEKITTKQLKIYDDDPEKLKKVNFEITKFMKPHVDFINFTLYL